MKNALRIATPGDRELVLSRDFDAPRSFVWDAISKPELLRRWLFGPVGWTMTDCVDEQKVGGTFRYVWKNDDGREMAMSGVIRELVPLEKCVRTERFEFGCEAQAGEQIATAVLTEKNGKTTLTTTVVYPSKEARDGSISSGVEKGVAVGYDRLEKLYMPTVA